MTHDRMEIEFAGQALTLDTRRALWWKKRDTLIVSDLHLGKALAYAHHATLLPPYEAFETLERLAALIVEYQPARLLCLGDRFHDARSFAALPGEVSARLRALSQSTRVEWILGNHDHALEAALPGEVHHDIREGGITFAHDEMGAALPAVIGHYHPKAMIRLQGRRLSRPCFAWDMRLLILPAFGAYTGGLNVRDAAVARLFPDGCSAMLADAPRAVAFSQAELEAY